MVKRKTAGNDLEHWLAHKADEGWKDIALGKAKHMTKEQFLKELATW